MANRKFACSVVHDEDILLRGRFDKKDLVNKNEHLIQINRTQMIHMNRC